MRIIQGEYFVDALKKCLILRNSANTCTRYFYLCYSILFIVMVMMKTEKKESKYSIISTFELDIGICLILLDIGLRIFVREKKYLNATLKTFNICEQVYATSHR